MRILLNLAVVAALLSFRRPMTLARRSAPGGLVLMISIAAGACADGPIVIVDDFPLPEDRTTVSLTPRDMTTHARRQIGWDESAQTVVAGSVVLEVALHNYARSPTDAEVERMLARTEFTTWPEAEQLEYEVERGSTGRQRTVLTLVPAERLEDGWYALRVLEDPGLAASDDFGRGLLSRFRVGSCPLLLSVEAYSVGSGVRLILSEVLDRAVLVEIDVLSLDGSSRCMPGFSDEGVLSPGAKLNYSCDFNATREGLKIEVPRSSPIAIPSDGEIRAEEFVDGAGGPNSQPKFYLAVPSETDEMPECRQ